MNEEDKVSSKLLDFEMNGITQRQKDVLARQINLLIDEAARKRDALEVTKLQRMHERLNAIKLNRSVNILDYMKDVFVEGQRYVFTLFDIGGIILYLFPSIAQSLIADVVLTRIIGGLIVVISFLLANFSLYKKLSEG